jgi:hypothetical protein
LRPVLARLEALGGRPLRILEVANEFFGGNVAVAGLLVGSDVARALRDDSEPAGVYLVPDVALKGDVFLDDVPLSDVAAEAAAPLLAIPPSAESLVRTLVA